MLRKAHKLGLLAGASVTVLGLLAGGAQAGGFGIIEQSGSFLGTSFAGVAAGGDLSSMYWNPAALVTVQGTNSEDHITAGRQNASVQAGPGSTLLGAPGVNSNSGNIYPDAVIPISYFGHQINDNLYFGVGLNAPFGSKTKPDNRVWAGMTLAETSQITTYNLNPNLAYRIAPGLSIGAGLQFELIKVREKFATSTAALGAPPSQWANSVLKGDDVGVGFTVGVHWQPNPATQIGLGYRSGIDHDVKGSLVGPGTGPTVPGVGNATAGSLGVSVPINLPDQATLSARHDLNSQFAVLGTAQWTHWSKLSSLDVNCTTVGTIPLLTLAGKCTGLGQQLESTKLNWDDGWFFSLGGEYKLNRAMLLRAGVAYEKSPIQNAAQQVTNIIDTDRIWVSTGLEYKLSPSMTADLSYAHVFFKDGNIDRTDPLTNIRVIGTTQRDADVLAIALKMRFGAAVEPLK